MMDHPPAPVRTILFMGLVGSGKGTQAHLLSEKTGFSVFSSGSHYRALAGQGTPLGKHVKEVIDRGYLMPEWFHTYVIVDVLFRLSSDEGIILEGVTKKKEEAIVFHEAMRWLERPYQVIYLNLPESVVVERLMQRHREEGRNDDRAESIPIRLQEYHTHTAKAVEYFQQQGTLISVNANQSREAVHQEVLNALG